MQKGYEFLVDSREKQKMKQLVKSRKIKHRVTALNADFVLRKLKRPSEDIVGIERKAVNDLVQSIQKGRLFEQAKRMRSHYPICYLMISGHLPTLESKLRHMGLKVKRSVIYGSLASLSVRERIHVLWLPDDKSLIDVAWRICCKISEGKYGDERLIAAKYSLYDPVKVLANHIPRLTVTEARALLKRFKNLKGIMLADKEQLQSINRVGPETASLIYNLFRKKA